MNNDNAVVIVGAGHGGVQLAASLREEGFGDAIVLLGDEKDLPYQRPPLSKAFMKRETPEDGVLLRGPDFYAQKAIDLRLGERAVEINSIGRTLRLASGLRIPYSKLVLATGGVQRSLPVEGAELDGVFSLRTLAEARFLRERLEAAQSVVIIGAGFIGLEFAAVAAAKGRNVQVIELAERPMARVVTPETSAFFAKAHEAFGVDLNFGTSVTAINGEGGRVREVVFSDGRVLPADLVLVGVGLVPSVELAKSAGLACPNGVGVDAQLATGNPDIFAIGDIALHPNPYAGRRVRLESVQNATDQARVLAKHLTGKPARYDSVPWFWSDQGDLSLQMVGFLEGCDKIILRGSYEERAYSLFGFKDRQLAGVESVNKAGDHMLARRLIGERIPISPELVADPTADLKALVKSRR